MGFFKRLFCLHFWREQSKSLTMLGVIVKWKCDKCGKTIERELYDDPISYMEDRPHMK